MCARLHTCVPVYVFVCMSRHATSPHCDTDLKVCGVACDVHCPVLKVPSQQVITSKETGQQRGELTPPSVHPTLFFSSRLLSLLLSFIVPTSCFFSFFSFFCLVDLMACHLFSLKAVCKYTFEQCMLNVHWHIALKHNHGNRHDVFSTWEERCENEVMCDNQSIINKLLH